MMLTFTAQAEVVADLSTNVDIRLTPEERLANLKAGIKVCWGANRYGLRLLWNWMRT